MGLNSRLWPGLDGVDVVGVDAVGRCCASCGVSWSVLSSALSRIMMAIWNGSIVKDLRLYRDQSRTALVLCECCCLKCVTEAEVSVSV